MCKPIIFFFLNWNIFSQKNIFFPDLIVNILRKKNSHSFDVRFFVFFVPYKILYILISSPITSFKIKCCLPETFKQVNLVILEIIFQTIIISTRPLGKSLRISSKLFRFTELISCNGGKSWYLLLIACTIHDCNKWFWLNFPYSLTVSWTKLIQSKTETENPVAELIF